MSCQGDGDARASTRLACYGDAGHLLRYESFRRLFLPEGHLFLLDAGSIDDHKPGVEGGSGGRDSKRCKLKVTSVKEFWDHHDKGPPLNVDNAQPPVTRGQALH